MEDRRKYLLNRHVSLNDLERIQPINFNIPNGLVGVLTAMDDYADEKIKPLEEEKNKWFDIAYRDSTKLDLVCEERNEIKKKYNELMDMLEHAFKAGRISDNTSFEQWSKIFFLNGGFKKFSLYNETPNSIATTNTEMINKK